jgi:hypothetical protein
MCIGEPADVYKVEWQDDILGWVLLAIAILLPLFLGYAMWEGHKDRKLKEASHQPIIKTS